MTLHQHPEHRIVTAHIEPAVAHLTFATETGMQRFIADNRREIRTQFVRWDVDFYPILTITAAKAA